MIRNLSQNQILATRVRRCTNPWTRLLGLLGTSSISAEETCWMRPCKSVHTFGMKYPLDIYFLNKKQEVIAVSKNLKPNRISGYYAAADSVLEFASGERDCAVGDQLVLECAAPGKKATLNAKGQSAVEFAITMIFFSMFIIGFSNVVGLCHNWVCLQFVVNEGGRYSLLGTTITQDDGTTKSRRDSVVKMIEDTGKSVGLTIQDDQVEFRDLSGNPLPDTGGSEAYVLLRVSIPFSNYKLSAQTMVKNEPFS